MIAVIRPKDGTTFTWVKAESLTHAFNAILGCPWTSVLRLGGVSTEDADQIKADYDAADPDDVKALRAWLIEHDAKLPT